MLKVLLIVVQGKPEGKVIPLVGPVFRVGRDESCHLRPNSVEVSRQHTEVTISDTEVTVKDLGSRNGTRVNGKLLSASHVLKSGELLQIGPLTFAVSIQGATGSLVTADAGAPKPAVTAAPAAPPRPRSLDDVPQDQIESWLIADNARPTPDRPSGVYDGDTLTISAFREQQAGPKAKPAPAPEVDKSPFDIPEDFERLEEGTGDPDPGEEAVDGEADTEPAAEEMPEEMIDENNPFYVAKKAAAAAKPAAETTKSAAQQQQDSSAAANDILRRMLDRRRTTR